MMKSLGVHAYRLSVAWPRVIPTGTGKVNAKGLAFYDKLIDDCSAPASRCITVAAGSIVIEPIGFPTTQKSSSTSCPTV